MKMVEIEIQGVTPLLQHRFGEQAEVETGKNTRRVAIAERVDPRAVAEAAAYRDVSGRYYHPASAIFRALREAAAGHKLRGSRRSAKFVVPAAVVMTDDAIYLGNGRPGEAPTLEVDSRPVTIPATKGRVMRHRARYNEWSARFAIEVNEEILPLDFVHQLLVEAGQQIGIGDYRPEKGGPFGRFRVTRWEEGR
jgi:hypothetical protein